MKFTILALITMLSDMFPLSKQDAILKHATMVVNDKYSINCQVVTHNVVGNIYDIVCNYDGLYFVVNMNSETKEYVADNYEENKLRVAREKTVQDAFRNYNIDTSVLTVYDGVQYIHYIEFSTMAVKNLDEVTAFVIERDLKKYKDDTFVLRVVPNVTLDYVHSMKKTFCMYNDEFTAFIDRIKQYRSATLSFDTNDGLYKAVSEIK